ncbi:Pycsar system effector family protein [Xanthocytophaga agilis]|uniref:DUF5706 domain-containing protein n=1 Tax=Xanthocytophaga agilis TaxID=3048010 RepID=A0AAE3RCU9_9BACT|nr:Pycsar system effector family protein [Xanthocytophaga agilis]MDJ1505522.1 DUF5706 domain-containing protein [Xanthocytophaga agilis]
MEERLRYIFGNVNDWLKFAETKNGALITLNGACIFGIFQIENWGNISDNFELWTKWLFVSSLAISTGLALFSFMPYTRSLNAQSKLNSDNPLDFKSLNFYFFGHIKFFDDKTFLEVLYKDTNTSIPNLYPKTEEFLARQIIVNARIASKKYGYFAWAIKFCVLGIAATCLFVLGKIIFG